MEALSYCSLLRSFRGVGREALIRTGAPGAGIHCDLLVGSRRVDIDVELTPGRRDKAVLNSQRVAGPKELVDVLRTTLFTPDDLELVKGGPAARRQLLDEAVLVTSPRLGSEQSHFERALRQRNALLRQLGGRLDKEAGVTLDVWDERLAAAGEAVVEGRELLVEAARRHVSEAWRALSGTAGELEMRYTRSFEGGLLEALVLKRAEDVRRQVTTVGPQRDELELSAGGLEARSQLSQGRQRSAALSLRLGIHRYVSDVTGAVPVLLLDDAFSELDRATATALVRELPAGQALLTTAGELPPEARPDLVVQVVGGKLIQ